MLCVLHGDVPELVGRSRWLPEQEIAVRPLLEGREASSLVCRVHGVRSLASRPWIVLCEYAVLQPVERHLHYLSSRS